jgi:hypothetical protein
MITMTPRFPFSLRLFFFAMLAWATSLVGATAATELNFTGHYVLNDAKAARTFSLDVTQTKTRAVVAFTAAMADGSGAAPEGTGKGHVEKGILSFKFKDSFNNEGTCTFQPAKDGYALVMTVAKVVDPGPLHFYGTFDLKRASTVSRIPAGK